jgi:hypothetical protein
MPKPKGSERKHKNTLAAFRKNKGNKLKPTHVALAQYMRPVSSVDIERCIARGTRTSVACTRHQRGEYQWSERDRASISTLGVSVPHLEVSAPSRLNLYTRCVCDTP